MVCTCISYTFVTRTEKMKGAKIVRVEVLHKMFPQVFCKVCFVLFNDDSRSKTPLGSAFQSRTIRMKKKFLVVVSLTNLCSSLTPFALVLLLTNFMYFFKSFASDVSFRFLINSIMSWISSQYMSGRVLSSRSRYL